MAKEFSKYLERQKRLTESSLSRLYLKYKEFDSGTISAYRDEYESDSNKERTLKLKTDLIRLGYSVTKINGVFKENLGTPNEKEVREVSFIVFDQFGKGNLKEDLIRLGEKYDQDSITYCNAETGKYYLIGTSKIRNAYPGYHKEVLLGSPMFGKDGEFFSKVKGRPFVFESLTDNKFDIDCQRTSYNISTIMALKHFGDDYILTH